MLKKPLIVIAGPTGIGKTEIAHTIAMDMAGEIVSADSRQIYRYMDIGTAKPSIELRQELPYHMLDIVDPDEDFSVADYKIQAESIIENIHARDKLPFLVGGTGLYIRSITTGLFISPPASLQLRAQLHEEAERYGVSYLYQKLCKIDPQAASRIASADLRRIIRALEVYYQTGQTISSLQAMKTEKKEYKLIMLCLNQDRQTLYRRIENRVDKMIESGWIDEVRWLLRKGYSCNLKAMEALGYKQLIKYIHGEYSLEYAIKEIKKLSRQFAKRQLTWFRGDKRFIWLPSEDIDNIRNVINTMLSTGC
jgi:tRNA dimethylallyltransferase